MCLHRSQSVETMTCIKQPVLQDHRTDPGHTCSEIQACAWTRSRIGNLKMALLWGGLGALLRTLLSCCHLSWLAGNTPSAQKNLLRLQVLPSGKQSHLSLFSLQSRPSLQAPLSPQRVCWVERCSFVSLGCPQDDSLLGPLHSNTLCQGVL